MRANSHRPKQQKRRRPKPRPTCQRCGSRNCVCPERPSQEWPGNGTSPEHESVSALADRLRANDMRVLFIRAVARLSPNTWAELSEECIGGLIDSATLNAWAQKYGMHVNATAPLRWIQTIAVRLFHERAMSLSLWSPSFSCDLCNRGKSAHTVGSHWNVRATAKMRSRAPSWTAEGRAQMVRRGGASLPHRRPRSAEVAAESLARQRILGQSCQEIVSLLRDERRINLAEESLRDLTNRAARTLGFEVRPRGRPTKNKD